jgi:membrane associated rhomboid family serine protease
VIPYKDLAPSHRFPFVTILLIAVNVAAFLYQIFLPEPAATEFVYRYAVIPLEFRLGHNIELSPGLAPILSIFTAMFLHGGWLHLIGNMLYLWIFGDNVEDRMGPFRFLIFYLLCGVIATLAQIYSDFRSDIPALGASGAIAGILAAYLRFYPKAQVAVLVPVFYFLRSVLLPAWLVLGLWFLIQILESHLPGSGTGGGGVAYFAHIGGFVAGLLFMPLFVRMRKRTGKIK